MLLILMSIHFGGLLGELFLVATGLFNASLFPSIFSLSVTGLNTEDLPHASAFLSTAICGGGVMPVLSGIVADHMGIGAAFVMPIFAYVLIVLGAKRCFPLEYRLRVG
jgi:FHS family L-fucose permease-like MFS transporter